MSRKIMRVPLDFAAPLDEVWEGYLMPEELRLPTCGDCDGMGSTAAAEWVHSLATLLLMLGEHAARPGKPLHPYLYRLMNRPGREPGQDAIELSTGLAGRAPSFFGHDSCDAWKATRAVISAAGLDPETWGRCPTCHGAGNVGTPEQVAAHEAWERADPPTGEGWQFWETVSEGSPQSPVFATADELVTWLVEHENYRLSAAQQLVSDGGSIGSFIMTATPEGHPVFLDSARDSDIIDVLGSED